MEIKYRQSFLKDLRSYRDLGESPASSKSHTLSPQQFKSDRLIGFTYLPI